MRKVGGGSFLLSSQRGINAWWLLAFVTAPKTYRNVKHIGASKSSGRQNFAEHLPSGVKRHIKRMWVQYCVRSWTRLLSQGPRSSPCSSLTNWVLISCLIWRSHASVLIVNLEVTDMIHYKTRCHNSSLFHTRSVNLVMNLSRYYHIPPNTCQ